ncbi:RtcB family protein [Rhodococcus hoagii]|nr:RtcB family protein [Prescottella equi]MBM4528533.1 RtcB family protein [Prescottella equi]MBM4545769.1 RtcB family protein [Prescottella equi]MBM4572534.1 RtcB family protein [Prescottella equi]MBM4601906.1 RtcB family protein [Prescottella equi]
MAWAIPASFVPDRSRTVSPTEYDHNLVNFASHIDDGTLAQARETASMPFVYPHIALMPDAHFGKGSAVGTVIPTRGAVIPAAVGVDIGCGMIAARTQFGLVDIERGGGAGRTLHTLRLGVERAIPLSPGNYNLTASLGKWFAEPKIAELEERAARDGVDLSHSPKWREQLGSLGGGNHFIELCLDEEDRVWLFLHSGSRGVGNKIAQKHIAIAQKLCRTWHIGLPNRDLAYLAEGAPEFWAYIWELRWAQRFALLNRAEMMDRFAEVFGEWIGAPVVEEERINCHHNYTEQEEHYGETVWLTRKGAVDAHEGVDAVIPGSMGTRSYVVRGKGDARGLCSAPHGAGRRFSRTQARKRFTVADLADRMKGIEYRHGAEWIDEIPDAYKDIDVVMDDARDLVEVRHTLRQILNVKGT